MKSIRNLGLEGLHLHQKVETCSSWSTCWSYRQRGTRSSMLFSSSTFINHRVTEGGCGSLHRNGMQDLVAKRQCRRIHFFFFVGFDRHICDVQKKEDQVIWEGLFNKLL